LELIATSWKLRHLRKQLSSNTEDQLLLSNRMKKMLSHQLKKLPLLKQKLDPLRLKLMKLNPNKKLNLRLLLKSHQKRRNQPLKPKFNLKITKANLLPSLMLKLELI
jgi:hypothetical protein